MVGERTSVAATQEGATKSKKPISLSRIVKHDFFCNSLYFTFSSLPVLLGSGTPLDATAVPTSSLALYKARKRVPLPVTGAFSRFLDKFRFIQGDRAPLTDEAVGVPPLDPLSLPNLLSPVDLVFYFSPAPWVRSSSFPHFPSPFPSSRTIGVSTFSRASKTYSPEPEEEEKNQRDEILINGNKTPAISTYP